MNPRLSGNYLSYINSDEWKSKRKQFFNSKLFAGVCHSCGYPDGPFDVHHKRYDRFGNERLNDLVALCRSCHDKAHYYLRTRKPKSTKRAIALQALRFARTGNVRPRKKRAKKIVDLSMHLRRWDD